MADVVGIFNLALSAVGSKSSISSPTERSREAEVCNLWYESVRDQVLHAAPWPATRASARLAVLAERDVADAWVASDPDPGYAFAYSAPSNMLRPRHLADFTRFILGVTTTNKRAIMTNTEDAILIYTKRQTNPNLWDSELHLAVVYALAAHIAMPLTAKLERAKYVEAQANNIITAARVAAANVDENQYESIPDWFAARGYAGVAPLTRYVYEFGPLIQVTSGVGVS